MPALRHPRREAFARARAEGKGLSESYAEAGYKPHAGNAYRLSKNEQICRRIEEIQSQTFQRTVTTIEDMIAQIDEDRRFARERGHSAAALGASRTKAQLLGFLAEQPAVALNFNYASMSEEELRSEIAALNEQARALKRGPLIDY
jgi:phage terminase small subunit